MPTRKQKNRKNRERGPNGPFLSRKALARTPSLAPSITNTLPTTPNTSTYENDTSNRYTSSSYTSTLYFEPPPYSPFYSEYLNYHYSSESISTPL